MAVSEWAYLAVLLAMAVAAAFVFDRIVLRYLHRWAKRTASALDDVVISALHPAIGILVGVVAFQAGLHQMGDRLPLGFLDSWSRFLLAFLILLVAFMGARLMGSLLRYGARGRPRFVSVARVGSRVLAVTIYVVAFLVILDTYGISITPIVTSLGIAGLAVALALQDTLSNFFAGVWVQTGKALQPGHFVRLEDHKLEGVVEEVGWRTTKIRQLTNTIIVVPNAKMAQAIVIDYDLPDTRLGTNLAFWVPFGTDLDLAQRILVEEVAAAGAQVGGLVADPAPNAVVRDTGELGVQVRVGFQVAEFTAQFPLQDEARKRILQRFAREGIELGRRWPTEPSQSPS